jgi:hypothetical protein
VEQGTGNPTEITNSRHSRPAFPNEILTAFQNPANFLFVETKADILADPRLQLCAFLFLSCGCCALRHHFLEPWPENVSFFFIT